VAKTQVQLQIVSYVFALFLFAGVGLLGWLKVLTSETTATILAALVGYWYGQRERHKQD
jgi:hypothetical protein